MHRETFDLFRYQLLPTTGASQISLFDSRAPRTPDEARARKNEYFAIALRELPALIHRGRPLTQRVIADAADVFAFRLGAKKSVERVTRQLQPERLESWPNVIVFVDNRPDRQLLAVSRNAKAFTSSAVVVSILRRAVNDVLQRYILQAHVEALFERRDFWALVRSFHARIVAAKFELISPNMANISRELQLDLAELNRATNSHRTDIELNSPDGAALELDEGNATLNSLVNYAASGGGDVSLKIKGMKKRVRTSKSVRSLEIDEATFEGPPEVIAESLRRLLE